MPARHSQTKDKLSGRRSPRKGNSVSKKKKKKKWNKRIVPVDTYVIINLAFVYSNHNYLLH